MRGHPVSITVTPLPQALGARVEGLDLNGPIGSDAASQLLHAWHENLVLFFPGLRMDEAQQMALGEIFGDLAATSQDASADLRQHETKGEQAQILVLDGARRQDRADSWHTDVTFADQPPIGSLLSMKVCPDTGGDTLWSNQYAAYEALSPAIRTLVDGLHAIHGRPGLTRTTTHPMVITHPGSGRRALFVNRGWTTGVEGLSPIEAKGLLEMLFNHTERPEFAVRWTWHAGDAALWDNRCTMHYAVNDYGSAERILNRVTIYERG